MHCTDEVMDHCEKALQCYLNLKGVIGRIIKSEKVIVKKDISGEKPYTEQNFNVVVVFFFFFFFFF